MKDKKDFRIPTLKEMLENTPEEEKNDSQLDKEMKRLEALAEGKINEDFHQGVMGGTQQGGSAYGHGRGETVNSFVENMYNDPSATYRHTAPLSADEGLEVAIKRALKSGAPVNNVSFYDEINVELQSLGFPAKQPIDIKTAILKMIS